MGTTWQAWPKPPQRRQSLWFFILCLYMEVYFFFNSLSFRLHNRCGKLECWIPMTFLSRSVIVHERLLWCLCVTLPMHRLSIWGVFFFHTTASDLFPVLFLIKEQDKSSDIEQHPPFGDRKYSNTQPQNRGLKNQREHHIILTKYEAMHPTVISAK